MGKAGFGGVGMLALLLMAQVFPARESTGIILPMLITADVIAVWRFRKFAVWKHILQLFLPAGIGVVVGWWIMPHIPSEVFGNWIGGMVLVLIVLLVFLRVLPSLRNLALEHPAIFWPVGLSLGITTMLANAAGPIATLYLLAKRLPKFEFVGTGAWLFLIINLFKVPFSASLGLITTESLLINLCAVPLIVTGVLAGRWLLGKISQSLFEILLLIFATAGALRLLLT